MWNGAASVIKKEGKSGEEKEEREGEHSRRRR
jgi:hypothetical protein